MEEGFNNKDSISRSSSLSSMEDRVDYKMGAHWYQYIFTNRCARGTLFLLVGVSIGGLVTASVCNSEEFLNVMKTPISNNLNYPLIPTIGIIILGSLIVSSVIYGIKKCKDQEKDFSDPFGFINLSGKK